MIKKIIVLVSIIFSAIQPGGSECTIGSLCSYCTNATIGDPCSYDGSNGSCYGNGYCMGGSALLAF